MWIGNLEVTSVQDGETEVSPAPTYLTYGATGKGTSAAYWAPHQDLLTEDGRLQSALGGFLVKTGERLLLVDTGYGRQETIPHSGYLLESLRAFGHSPDQITDVLLTEHSSEKDHLFRLNATTCSGRK